MLTRTSKIFARIHSTRPNTQTPGSHGFNSRRCGACRDVAQRESTRTSHRGLFTRIRAIQFRASNHRSPTRKLLGSNPSSATIFSRCGVPFGRQFTSYVILTCGFDTRTPEQFRFRCTHSQKPYTQILGSIPGRSTTTTQVVIRGECRWYGTHSYTVNPTVASALECAISLASQAPAP